MIHHVRDHAAEQTERASVCDVSLLSAAVRERRDVDR
jgi:hypothetical protein